MTNWEVLWPTLLQLPPPCFSAFQALLDLVRGPHSQRTGSWRIAGHSCADHSAILSAFQSLKYQNPKFASATRPPSRRDDFYDDSLDRHPRPGPGADIEVPSGSRHTHPRIEPLLVAARRGTCQPARKGPRSSEATDQDHPSSPSKAAHYLGVALQYLREARGAARSEQCRPLPRDPYHPTASRREHPGVRRKCIGSRVAGPHSGAGRASDREGQSQDIRELPAGRHCEGWSGTSPRCHLRRPRCSAWTNRNSPDFPGWPGELLPVDGQERVWSHHGDERGRQHHVPRQLEGVQGPRDGHQRAPQGREAILRQSRFSPTRYRTRVASRTALDAAVASRRSRGQTERRLCWPFQHVKLVQAPSHLGL